VTQVEVTAEFIEAALEGLAADKAKGAAAG
jgi:hypothetical protein